ncbi:hypothetical protein DMB66_32720 [Actinoplanes sp. ATCC 53533]|uniref:hypothetical protein n=1 Tax=Actinoplanes sp. ATCC 53533 TaxID=1288362 RepID=UPI000F7A1184|nr:hypothetical protein [Actinoplanes sp. ATCC 53533]RSM56839.1 hypothetical protein DMB66_32720 [Actinoplanes sp. ATCC 53533]
MLKQQKSGKAVNKSNKKTGDLLIFRSGSSGTHVASTATCGPPSPRRRTVQEQKVYSKNYVVRRLVST